MSTDESIDWTPSEKAWVLKAVPSAREQVLGNLRRFEQHPVPLLLAGEVYAGVWLEHNQDNLFLTELAPESAWASQQVFMDHQREDGLLPFMFRLKIEKGERAAFWHLQSVYPFARCALEVAMKLGKPESCFAAIHASAARYDAWLVKNRNRSGSGLVEMFCEWDTGHDNSPKVMEGGIPHTCPGNDAANMPDLACMPVQSVDLSAMRYGGLTALAELARRIGKDHERRLREEQAQELACTMRRLLYDEETEFYYDRSPSGLRKYRSEHITRLFLNGVLSQAEFDRIWARHFTGADGFWTAFPFPSMSVSDPSFNKALPKNCWGGNTQALTVLRALLWMEKYGREKELKELLRRWLTAMARFQNQGTQEISPFDGSPIGTGKGYTPTLLLTLEAAKRVGIS